MSPKKILLVRTDRIGDVVLSTPVIAALKEAFPEASVSMLVRPELKELLAGHPGLDQVLLYDKKGAHKSWLGSLRFAKSLKAHQFDAALILHSTNRSVLTTWLAGIPVRIGYGRRLPQLLTHVVPYIKHEGLRHELDYNAALLRQLGVDVGNSQVLQTPFQGMQVPVQAEHQATVATFLEEQGRDANKPLVVLHPGASCPSKRWPLERFAALGDVLANQADVLVMTGPAEAEQGEQVVQKMSAPALKATGSLSLGQTAALLAQADVLVSNDSGPVHIASAVRTPVVSIFGRWSPGLGPTRWGPIGPNSVVLHKDIGCRPCLAHACTIGFACLEAISVEDVAGAAQHLLRQEQ